MTFVTNSQVSIVVIFRDAKNSCGPRLVRGVRLNYEADGQFVVLDCVNHPIGWFMRLKNAAFQKGRDALIQYRAVFEPIERVESGKCIYRYHPDQI